MVTPVFFPPVLCFAPPGNSGLRVPIDLKLNFLIIFFLGFSLFPGGIYPCFHV